MKKLVNRLIEKPDPDIQVLTDLLLILGLYNPTDICETWDYK